MNRLYAAIAVIGIMAVALPASAQITGAPPPGYRIAPGQPASSVPDILREIGYDQKLDGQLPLGTLFRDETGKTVALGTFFGSRPVILNFVYYECPMLCTQVLNGLASTLSVLSLEPGKDFEIVTISIDPRETPRLATEKKTSYLARYRRPTAAAGWHFLTGDESSIARATKAAGFKYVWDDRLKQFAHPTGVIVATPQGRISRYLFGIEYGPRDMRLALVEASERKIGTPIDNVLLYCFHYDPVTGKYGFVVMRVVRIAAAATVVALGMFIVVMVRRDRRQLPPGSPSTAGTRPGAAPGTAPGTRPGTAPDARHGPSLADELARASAASRRSLPADAPGQAKADSARSTF